MSANALGSNSSARRSARTALELKGRVATLRFPSLAKEGQGVDRSTSAEICSEVDRTTPSPSFAREGNRCSKTANGLCILMLPRLVCDRHSAIPAEGPRRNLHPGRGLAAFVFVAVHHSDDASYGLLIESHVHHLRKAAILFHV